MGEGHVSVRAEGRARRGGSEGVEETCLRMRDMRPLSPDSRVAPLLSLSISQ